MSKATLVQPAVVFLHITAAPQAEPDIHREMLLPLNGTRFEYDEALNRTEIHLADGQLYFTPKFVKRIADCIRGLDKADATCLV